MAGLVVAIGSLFAFLLLFLIDTFSQSANPYLGILTWLVAPAFLFLGLIGVAAGGIWQHRERVKAGHRFAITFDLSRAHDRKILGFFVFGGGAFLFLTAIGTYSSYHFTESTTFCGQACHTVMEPEMVTYRHSPHARVSCTACHIGPGAAWFVRSKLSGTYQVYATLTKKYPRPIPTPVRNLRPAQDTCEQCHWPKEFVGNLDRSFVSYLNEASNSVHTVRLLLKVGGADPTHGPVGGIHWHMSVANKVQYIATDPERQKIPWVRTVNTQGIVTEYRSPNFTNDIAGYELRTMDCMDCHNRPSHRYTPPNEAVSLAMMLGRLDSSWPWLKSNAVYALSATYTNVPQAKTSISNLLFTAYSGRPKLPEAISEVHQIYTNNFFPEMKANWRKYPQNIGHKDWPGCTRCHDDEHVSSDKQHKIQFRDCNQCHLIIAQGAGPELKKLNAAGFAFKHPGGDIETYACSDCHNGGL